jgi:5-dehydro-4-deoxyglucarate dehydratase
MLDTVSVMSTVVKTWKGVFGFPVTPLKQNLSVDLEALRKNVDWMTKNPFCAFVCAGGTGELYSLTAEEVGDITRVSVEAAQGRMDVVAGTGFNVPIGADMAKRAEKAGAAALLILPPYYQNPPEEGLYQYYEAIAGATSLPVLIYSREWATFSPKQVAELAKRIPNLLGWKDGQGDARKYQRIMNEVGDRLAWFGGIGDDCVPGYFAVGVQAYTSSISNIAPMLSLMLAEAGMKRDFGKLSELMAKYVHPLYAIRDRLRGYEVSVMKEAMEILGMPAGPVRPPLVNTRPQDVDDVRALMKVYEDVL